MPRPSSSFAESPTEPPGRPWQEPLTREPAGDTWVALSGQPLEPSDISTWVAAPDCGAVVSFTGLVRDHAEGRPDVSALEYEAYEEQAEARIEAVVDEVRRRWPEVRRVAAIHRVGRLTVGEAAVVVAVSSPHRTAAFAAAGYCIDALKSTVPIWKKETWPGGEAWGVDATAIDPVAP